MQTSGDLSSHAIFPPSLQILIMIPDAHPISGRFASVVVNSDWCPSVLLVDYSRKRLMLDRTL